MIEGEVISNVYDYFILHDIWHNFVWYNFVSVTLFSGLF